MSTDSLLMAVSQAQPWNGHMWGWRLGWMWVAGVLAMLMLGVVVAAIAWAAARTGQPRQPDPTTRAREILNERYARGEISTEEYRERLDALR